MGISSGLVFLVLSSVDIWLAESGFSKSAIGLFSLAHIPYVIKFLCAPFIERIKIFKTLPHKKSWIFLSHAIIFLGLIMLSFCEPKKEVILLFVSIVLVKLGNSVQNIVSYSFQIDKTPPALLSKNAAFFTFGFRIGLFVCSYGLLIIAHYVSWRIAFIVLAILSATSSIIFLLRDEPSLIIKKELFNKKLLDLTKNHSFFASTLIGYLVIPVKLFSKKEINWKLILLLITLIKTGDTLCHKMAPIMYLEIGFSKAELANIVKCFGLIATTLGGFTVYKSETKSAILKALEASLLMHSVTTLLYIAMHHVGHSPCVLAATIFVENFTGGMLMSALLAFLYYYSNSSQYPAVMYTVFFGFYSLNNMLVASISGILADNMGWDRYFLTAFVISMSLVILTKFLRHKIKIK